MVDFHNESTVGTPALDVVKILILQRRYDVFEALEIYNKDKLANQEVSNTLLKSRLFTWFVEIQASLKRRLSKKDYEDLYNKITSDDEGAILEAIFIMNEELDNINLTKIDQRKQFDTTNMLKENKMKGI